MNGYRQTHWMDGRGNTDWMDAYIDGGRMISVRIPGTVKDEDWREIRPQTVMEQQIRFKQCTVIII